MNANRLSVCRKRVEIFICENTIIKPELFMTPWIPFRIVEKSFFKDLFSHGRQMPVRIRQTEPADVIRSIFWVSRYWSTVATQAEHKACLCSAEFHWTLFYRHSYCTAWRLYILLNGPLLRRPSAISIGGHQSASSSWKKLMPAVETS